MGLEADRTEGGIECRPAARPPDGGSVVAAEDRELGGGRGDSAVISTARTSSQASNVCGPTPESHVSNRQGRKDRPSGPNPNIPVRPRREPKSARIRPMRATTLARMTWPRTDTTSTGTVSPTGPEHHEDVETGDSTHRRRLLQAVRRSTLVRWLAGEGAGELRGPLDWYYNGR